MWSSVYNPSLGSEQKFLLQVLQGNICHGDCGGQEPLKGMDWKNIVNSVVDEPSAEPVVKKRLPKKMRQIPECYFLPRRSNPSAISFYGSSIVSGVGAGMLAETWINKKVKEDGGVIWEF